MLDQTRYYDQFGSLHAQSILTCPQPELWTTDYAEKGRIYQEIKSRIKKQENFISTYLKPGIPVLDLGCGFGRQAILLAKKGYPVTGTDTSPVFIGLAKKLFQQFNLKGEFSCTDLLTDVWTAGKFSQLILFDVLEHIPPRKRKAFIQKIGEVSEPHAILLVSLPHVRKRWRSQINNRFRKNLTMHFSWFYRKDEHPYPIPQQKDISSLASDLFKIILFESSADTDYYVLQKTS